MTTYHELIQFPTFQERFDLLRQNGLVGEQTFGGHRHLNQQLYQSSKWRKLRNEIIIRDLGNDLAVNGLSITGPIYIHHITPVTVDDLLSQNGIVYDPENLICTSFATHQALHYERGTPLIPPETTERKPYDTCPWR